MRLPGFGAESSLYKVGVHYQIAEGSDHPYGVTPQIACGECYWDKTGTCVMDCKYPWETDTVPCRSPRHCPPKPPCCPPGCLGTC